ncbi:peptidylprolyl isomerase/FKBP-type peptidyl-prolyl cis-trans isomerase FkpA [Chitinophaga sp. YR627]|uniref:FKBP-type peptidyl-prolyl cis-trans isomerase n=1 Tax=Chitinophaga sp. YR627 TaxID=1881041 RepID=UPI0008E3A6CF|nr:FKBP-type peptidyl-prolyl cis-trans isomerase [Chitinophaga sp. YR627]SFO56879.1 peptidylprolyl isomerase/FKBP-type peptidyl-prolyl cis-trans isomerase FkpA [Chitinophaga sp. YR627]
MKRFRMRHLLFIGAAMMMVFFAACSKDNTEPYDPTPQFNKDVDSIKAYLKAKNLTAIQDSVSGIFYNISAPGNGVDSVKYNTTKVNVLYTGKLLNDMVFDSTTGTTTREFYAGQVIVGWQFALTRISKGGKIRVYIPSYYGYGNQAKGNIPANSPLIFDIELVNLTNPIQ